MRVRHVVGQDANDQNLLLRDALFIMRLPGLFALKRISSVVCHLRSQNESDPCDCKSDWDRTVVIRSADGPVGDVVGAACEAGQEALVYGARKFRQLRRIFSTLELVVARRHAISP